MRNLLKGGLMLASLGLGMVHAAQAQNADPALVEQGRRVAVAADCTACHTAPGGQAFAGGYAVTSPLGKIWSTNITPSKADGIGTWSAADFDRAVRKGVLPDGTHLYPAMPYDAYAGITDADMTALYAYFMNGVEPVDAAPQHHTHLPFPFNIRASMAIWNLMFARNTAFTPAPDASDAVNRGDYLVNALAHCGTCHTPRGTLMQSLGNRALAGAYVGRWYAPNITPGASGLGDWSEAEIVAYLGTGRAKGRAQAGGPMAEAVEHSLQYLPQEDLHAIAAYLTSVPAVAGDAGSGHHAVPGAGGTPAAVDDEAAIRGTHSQNSHNSLTNGAELYSGNCASCHMPDGRGSTNQAYPSLIANTVTRSVNPTNLIATMLDGVSREVDSHAVQMPSFGPGSYFSPLDDDAIAQIATYVRQKFGGQQEPVTADQVATVRSGGPVPVLVKVQPYVPYLILAAVVIALLVILLVVMGLARRKSTQARV